MERGGRKSLTDLVKCVDNLHFKTKPEKEKKSTGQTTVNKKALIHYIISINDMVHRPLLKNLKKSPPNSMIRPSNLIYCG